MNHQGHELELIHEGEIITNTSAIMRPFLAMCKECGMLAACTNEQEARSVLEWHQRITERLAKC